jgi:hypothetical protein
MVSETMGINSTTTDTSNVTTGTSSAQMATSQGSRGADTTMVHQCVELCSYRAHVASVQGAGTSYESAPLRMITSGKGNVSATWTLKLSSPTGSSYPEEFQAGT